LFRKKGIDEWALDYWLLQRYAKLCFRIYFRKIEIANLHRISLDNPVILAPNHQNALMDAMTIVCNTNLQPVFLARADIFKGKRMSRFLNYLNIMPIYRIRDGLVNVKKNDEIFEKTIRVLHNRNNPLILFPEGNHGDKRRLRPLVKGLYRIAFLAQERAGEKPDVKIIPVGIDYGHYQHFRSTLFINVGEPVNVSSFYKEHSENPVAAINSLKDTYAAEISKLMIDIQTEEYYELYMAMREIFNDDMRKLSGISDHSLASRFKADKLMIDMLNKELDKNPAMISKLNNLVIPYIAGVKQAGLRDWVLKRDHYNPVVMFLSCVIGILFLPVFIFGFINNILPYWFTATRVKNLKDPQFHSSFKYVTGMLTFPAWYIVTAGILALFSLSFGAIVLYIFLLPLVGLAAFEYYIFVRKLKGKLKHFFRRNSPEIKTLKERRKIIISMMQKIITGNQTIA
jgi:1-acyl-sn-glycerol-3-phosphate acyltransferase